MVDMAHIAGLVAAKVHPDPVPHADFVTTTTHKTLRGPRGGMVLCKEQYAKPIDSAVFPGMQGGPLMHVIAAKAVAFGEALRPDFKEPTSQQVHCQRQGARGGADVALGFRHRISGGTDNHLMLVDVATKSGSRRQAGRAGPRPGRHHRQQEHDPLRPPQADGPVGRAASARRPSRPAA